MLEPDDETVSDWYAARNNRHRPPGTRDAMVLDPGARHGLLFQDTPRLVVEWDGSEWQPVGVAANYSEAYSVIVRRGADPVSPQDDTPVALLRKGSGRHRRN
ncbi:MULTISPECIES: DUF6087 family protein [Streptomyces]|uniref:DUF6087 family protein n=1 Tax=Streptomyces TaxID=1883 RepID=UPI0004AABB4C|nr:MULTISPECIES: DUF6087 family protein [Streptomyces]